MNWPAARKWKKFYANRKICWLQNAKKGTARTVPFSLVYVIDYY